MFTYHQIDPVIFTIGPLAVRWYGVMYLLGFAAAYVLSLHLSRLRGLPLAKEGVSDLLFYGVLGVVCGHLAHSQAQRGGWAHPPRLPTLRCLQRGGDAPRCQ